MKYYNYIHKIQKKFLLNFLHKNSIKLFYWNHLFNNKYNLGDLLSKYIVEQISQKKVYYVDRNIKNKLCAIGSIIDNETLASGGTFWGSGTFRNDLKFYANDCNFLAVRGPITRKILINAGYNCRELYGDPALLLPKFIPPPPYRDIKYKYGLICHWSHRKKVYIDNDVLFIDILRQEHEIKDFIYELMQCEIILSSSLHGIIIANAYGIPARWFIFEDYPLEYKAKLKFIDYFQSVKIPIQRPLVFKKTATFSSNMKINVDKNLDLKIDLKALHDVFYNYISK